MTTSPLDAPVPSSWRRTQRVKNDIIYWSLRLLVATLRRIPYVLASASAPALGWIAGLLMRPDRRRADAQLRERLGEADPRRRRRLVRRMFVHFARSLVELLHVRRFVAGPSRIGIGAAERATLDAAFAEGRGVVLVTGHIGNWELLAQVLANAGYGVNCVAKPLYDPRLTRWVHAERTRFGMQVLWRGDPHTGQNLKQTFAHNRMLAVLIDQDTKVQGAFVPFFGKPAFTPTAAAELAQRFAAPVVVVWMHRHAGRHVVNVVRVPLHSDADPGDDPIRELTARLNRQLEDAIRECPEQWVWLHARWRRQPDAAAPSQAREQTTQTPIVP